MEAAGGPHVYDVQGPLLGTHHSMPVARGKDGAQPIPCLYCSQTSARPALQGSKSASCMFVGLGESDVCFWVQVNLMGVSGFRRVLCVLVGSGESCVCFWVQVSLTCDGGFRTGFR